MRQLCALSLVVPVLICTGAAAAFALTSYSGSLSSPTGISGTGAWISPGVTSLSWTVSQTNPGDPWHYVYNFSVPVGGVSHFILEVSPDFSLDDMFNRTGSGSSISLGTFKPTDPGNDNPGLPGDIYGIKFDGVGITTPTFAFDSFRAPVWHDFYAKDGTAGNPQGVFNAAWDTGFTANDTDPMDPPRDGSVSYHILSPDTAIEPIPDSSTLVLGSMSMLPFAVSMLRRRK